MQRKNFRKLKTKYMSLFIESIQFKNGNLQNLEFHNKRFNKSRKDLFGIEKEDNLIDIIDTSKLFSNKTYRITVSYSENIDKIITIYYTKKIINSLKIVEASPYFDYSYKYADRSGIEKLLSKKGSCDDIIIVKDKLISDISFANLVFYDGAKYYTPSSPLLKGTKREKLILEGEISEEEISVNDLYLFKYCGIINAMLELRDYKIEIRKIFP